MGRKEIAAKNNLHNETYPKRKADEAKRNKAVYLVTRAIKAGRLVRGPCAVCGVAERTEGHHPDYDKPLEVVWLCNKHHAMEHKRIRAQRKYNLTTL